MPFIRGSTLLLVLLLSAARAAAGDLGAREVRGRVYDLTGGPDALIAGATLSYASESGGGLVSSNDRGQFAFTLVLNDADHVRITATTRGYEPATITLSARDVVYRFAAVELGLVPVQSSHRISGHLSSDILCTRDAAGIGITLEPTGRSTLTAADGTFAFEQVSDGEYVLHIETGDFDVPAVVVGEDVVVQFCIHCADALTIAPQFGPPGTTVSARGSCYAVHSGRLATIYFDDALVAEERGDTGGGFSTSFVVPLDAALGTHTVYLKGGTSSLASAQFVVQVAGGPCAGDCDDDDTVTITELVRGIALVLGIEGAECAAYDAATVGIAQLISAVDSALNGCPRQVARRR